MALTGNIKIQHQETLDYLIDAIDTDGLLEGVFDRVYTNATLTQQSIKLYKGRALNFFITSVKQVTQHLHNFYTLGFSINIVLPPEDDHPRIIDLLIAALYQGEPGITGGQSTGLDLQVDLLDQTFNNSLVYSIKFSVETERFHFNRRVFEEE